jgi:ribonucleoside-diphosphate reductase alpha chain
MLAGFFKVAEAYILYRSERAKLRKSGKLDDGRSSSVAIQESMVLTKDEKGENFLWDGSDLQARIAFAHAGTDSHPTNEEVVSALRDGIVSDIDISTLPECIIENARGLIERDPGFAIFAARIQLSYLYEENFDWYCTSDGMQ